MNGFAVLVLGWPSAVAGAALLVAGVATDSRGLTALGALVASGFCAFVGMHPPPAGWLGLAALVTNWLAALAIARRARSLAAVALVPFIVTLVLVGHAVLTQSASG